MIQQYDEHADRYEAAFDAFARVYKKENPPPVAPSSRSALTFTMTGLFVVTAAAVFVSGSRTIAEFGGGPVGWASFVMLEVFFIFASYIITMRHDGDMRTNWVIYAGIGVSGLVMLGANLDATANAKGTLLADILDRAILIGVALSAPLLAMITGHLAALEWKSTLRRRSVESARYHEQLERWRDGLNAAWGTNKGKYGVGIRVERERPVNEPQIPVHSLRSFTEPSEYTKNMSAREIISGWFTEHPERINENVDALWQDIMNDTGRKVGRTSVHNVRSELRGGKQ